MIGLTCEEAVMLTIPSDMIPNDSAGAESDIQTLAPHDGTSCRVILMSCLSMEERANLLVPSFFDSSILQLHLLHRYRRLGFWVFEGLGV